jgi:transcriptional regulator with XRE-family HTH domain
MPVRNTQVDEADRRARWQLSEVLRTLRAARHAAGLSQATVGSVLRNSHQLVSEWERGRQVPDPIQLARWGAVVGLDVPIRAFPAGSPLRDVAQLKLIARARTAIGGRWTWRTEVPVSSDPLDRRAVDAVLQGAAGRVGLEVISRLTDAQGQVRAILLKQQASGIDRMILVLAETRHNRAALAAAGPTVMPAFPLTTRGVLGALRAGRIPEANGVILI